MPTRDVAESETANQTPVKSRVDEITAILRDEILRGQYRPGERLPSERDLAARFEANRGAIRESLKKLEQLGIAAIHPGGARIVPIEEASLLILRPLIALPDVPDPTLITHLLEVWGTLMAMAVKTAVSCATDDEINQMLDIISRMLDDSISVDESQVCWHDLAKRFTEINNNLVLRLILNGLVTQFLDKTKDKRQLKIEPNLTRRKAILELLQTSLQQRNPEAAATALLQHFQLVADAVTSAIHKQQKTLAQMEQSS